MVRLPERFGDYEPLFRLGHGGMAEVFVARKRGEAGFQKLVAVKRMHPHLAQDPTFAAMFLDEARLASHVASPHVVSTLDLGRTADGAPYIVLAFVLGVDLGVILGELAQRGALMPADVAVALIAQTAIGLHDAHEARTPDGRALGLVHRDVSPSNLLVGVDGRVRVSDFGVAWAIERSTHTLHGQRKGKYGYFSPEQAASRELDRRSDVFSLGIVTWETLCARPLFLPGTALEARDGGGGVPPPLSAFRGDVPPAVEAAMARALAHDRDARFATARDYADALLDAAHGAGLEPSETRVAEFLSALAPQRLTAVRERLRGVASSAPHDDGASVHDAPTRVVVAGPLQEEGTTAVPSEDP